MVNKSIEELFQKAQNGDKKAREQLIIDNMRMVYMIARKYKSDMTDLDTIIQEGMIGLIKAIDKFEVERGLQFSTYAFRIIRGEMQRFIRDKREDMPYRIQRTNNQIYNEIRKARNTLAQQLGREPSNKEIALWVGVDEERVEESINVIENRRSLYGTKYCGEKTDDISLIESVENQNRITEDNIIDSIRVKEALKHLDNKQRRVIELRYMNDLTQKETGKRLNFTQVTICRIEKRALEILKTVI